MISDNTRSINRNIVECKESLVVLKTDRKKYE